jgi:hypothetical protein
MVAMLWTAVAGALLGVAAAAAAVRSARPRPLRR